jgi:zinc transport system substrate-binding protein
VLIATHPRYQYLARATGLTIHALDWEAGAAPDAAQLADLAARAAETGAVALLWEAEPPAEARAAVRALGLADAVVPSFAAPATGGFSARLEVALAELETALATAR